MLEMDGPSDLYTTGEMQTREIDTFSRVFSSFANSEPKCVVLLMVKDYPNGKSSIAYSVREAAPESSWLPNKDTCGDYLQSFLNAGLVMFL